MSTGKFSIGLNNVSTRDAWLEKSLAKIPAHSRILDAGAGELRYKKFCSHLQYVSQDFGGYNGQGDNTGLQTGTWDQTKLDIVCDICTIPVKDNSFDAILCVEVFEHLPDSMCAIREFSRILKPGGTLILTAPFCSLTHFAPYHFSTGFNKYFYETNLTKHGFKITEVTTNGNFYEYLAQEVRRLPSVYAQYDHTDTKIGKFITRFILFSYRRMILPVFLFILNHLSKRDSNSSELLCFGYHIITVKNKG